jgi:uncharacterized SAM-binding protein YcdF (DUF218 family)
MVFAQKALGRLFSPDLLCLALFAAAAASFALGRPAIGWTLAAAGAAAAAAALAFPGAVGACLARALARRTPARALPARVEGIAVLAGGAERVDAFCELVRRFPEARRLFIGAAGPTVLGRPHLRAAAEERMRLRGIDPATVVFEPRSRNTRENARCARELIGPAGVRLSWLLVTSDWHMPRALACFRAVGWSVTPHGCSEPLAYASWRAKRALLACATREWIALFAYRLLGFTRPIE